MPHRAGPRMEGLLHCVCGFNPHPFPLTVPGPAGTSGGTWDEASHTPRIKYSATGNLLKSDLASLPAPA